LKSPPSHIAHFCILARWNRFVPVCLEVHLASLGACQGAENNTLTMYSSLSYQRSDSAPLVVGTGGGETSQGLRSGGQFPRTEVQGLLNCL
jgi:hypothetical protein